MLSYILFVHIKQIIYMITYIDKIHIDILRDHLYVYDQFISNNMIYLILYDYILLSIYYYDILYFIYLL